MPKLCVFRCLICLLLTRGHVKSLSEIHVTASALIPYSFMFYCVSVTEQVVRWLAALMEHYCAVCVRQVSFHSPVELCHTIIMNIEIINFGKSQRAFVCSLKTQQVSELSAEPMCLV